MAFFADCNKQIKGSANTWKTVIWPDETRSESFGLHAKHQQTGN